MSHTAQQSRPISRPHSQKLDKQMESLDRAHQGRQNANAQPIKLTPPKPQKPR